MENPQDRSQNEARVIDFKKARENKLSAKSEFGPIAKGIVNFKQKDKDE